MPIIRPTALRGLHNSLRHTTVRATARTAPARTQLVARRYASGGGGHGSGHGEASSDLPWMLGALAITPPACWYLWPDTSHAEHHGAHDAHGAHDDHSEGSEEKQDEQDEAAQETSAPAEQAGDKSGDDSTDGEEKASGSEAESQSEPAAKETEAKGTTEQKEGGSEQQGDNAEGKAEGKTDSSSESSRVKRIDSGLGKTLGAGSASDSEESQAKGSSQGDITQKQKGLSTTDTKHSVQIDQRDDKSTKGSGEPETAKAKGTVDSSGPITGGPGKN